MQKSNPEVLVTAAGIVVAGEVWAMLVAPLAVPYVSDAMEKGG